MARCLTCTSFFLTFLGFLGQASPCRAQGFVEHLEPPALERGKTTRVTVVGSGLGKALDLWTSLSKGAVKATPAGEQTTHAARRWT